VSRDPEDSLVRTFGVAELGQWCVLSNPDCGAYYLILIYHINSDNVVVPQVPTSVNIAVVVAVPPVIGLFLVLALF
jgi:hypothetical protein